MCIFYFFIFYIFFVVLFFIISYSYFLLSLQMVRDIAEGPGTLTIDQSKKYVGKFQANLRNEDGVASDGAWKYTGGWKDGLFFGQGELCDYHGVVYVGGFEDGLFHGKGEEKRPGGAEYVGKFVRGRREGEGREKLPNGEVYDGEWKRNCRHGKGTLKNKKGVEIYKGSWKHGLYQGKGMMRIECRTGVIMKLDGNWKNGEPDGDMNVIYEGGKVSCGGKGEAGEGASSAQVSEKVSKFFAKKKSKLLAPSASPSSSSSPSTSKFSSSSSSQPNPSRWNQPQQGSCPFTQEQINESLAKAKGGLTLSNNNGSMAFVCPPKNPKFSVNFL